MVLSSIFDVHFTFGCASIGRSITVYHIVLIRVSIEIGLDTRSLLDEWMFPRISPVLMNQLRTIC